MRRLYFIVLMGCTSLVGVGDLTLSPDASSNDASSGDVMPPPTCGSPGPTDGMVAYFPFDEDAGSCATNCVPPLNACTPDGGPAMWSWATKTYWRGGGAIQVTSSASCMRIRGLADLDQSTFSVSMWLFTNDIPSMYGAIITHHPNSNTAGWDLVANDVDAAHSVELRLFGSGGTGMGVLSTPGLVLKSGWQHVIMTAAPDAASSVRIGDASVSAKLPPIVATTSDLVIGCRGDNSYQFDGYIDELRIYDHALSDQEIADLEK